MYRSETKYCSLKYDISCLYHDAMSAHRHSPSFSLRLMINLGVSLGKLKEEENDLIIGKLTIDSCSKRERL